MAFEQQNDPDFCSHVRFTRTMLRSLDNKLFQACSISTVSEQLRKSKVEAYIPKAVSVGPLHRGNRELQQTEILKWHFMQSLIGRSISAEEESETEKMLDERVTKLYGAMLELDELVRASYNVDDIKFNSYDLAQIMLLDGCFLLEDIMFDCNEPSPPFTSSNIESMELHEKIISDLTLLENQIPLFVVLKIFEVLFSEVYTGGDVTSIINNQALSFLGYNNPQGSSIHLKTSHYLELVHSFLSTKEDGIEQLPNTEEVGVKKLKQCATRLQAAGVKIQARQGNNPVLQPAVPGITLDMPDGCLNQKQHGNIITVGRIFRDFRRIVVQLIQMLKTKHMKGDGRRKLQGRTWDPNGVLGCRAKDIRFDLNITFSNGVLEIPPLHITETTEARWRNFIAWEVNRMENESEIICSFIRYAWFFQGLICCVHDIQLLRDKEIIVVHEWERKNEGKTDKMQSNEDLLNLFRTITKGVPHNQIDFADSWSDPVIKKLNSHTATVNWVTRTRIIVWHVFRCVVTWIWYKCRDSCRVLRRDYIPTGWKLIAVLAAAAGLVLTLIQTIFAAHGN